jgi:hypothetical protein
MECRIMSMRGIGGKRRREGRAEIRQGNVIDLV